MAAREKVCVVGLGYIGLPTAVVLAQSGKQVVGVDVSQRVVDSINSGRAHIVEPDLDGLLHHVVREGRLRAQTMPEEADVFIVAVPTPFKDDHVPDLDHVASAARSIAPFLRSGNLVILESTVPPGTTSRLVSWILEERPDLREPNGVGRSFHAAHCPERVLPGRILHEIVQNDRVVGGLDEESTAIARRFYQSFVRGDCVGTSATTAELVKLSENAYRDVNIAFANELSMVAHDLGVDASEVISLANRHPRVAILQPGPGVGGHCIAVDPWFIVSGAPNRTPLIRAAREVNLAKTEWVVEQVLQVAAKLPSEKVLAILGLAYKADIDDLRESPALDVAMAVAGAISARCVVVEPNISEVPAALAGKGLELMDLDDALEIASLVVLLVAHAEFRQISTEATAAASVLDFTGRPSGSGGTS